MLPPWLIEHVSKQAPDPPTYQQLPVPVPPSIPPPYVVDDVGVDGRVEIDFTINVITL